MGKNNTADISVIIPTYNRLNTLKKVIGSYTDQKEVGEVIIVDDCSSDGTKQYMSSLSTKNNKIKYHRNEINMGAPFSRNRAISLSTGNYIFVGEDDLELTQNYFKELFDHMKRKGADIIAGRRIWLQKNETKAQGLLRANNSTGQIFNKKLLITNCELLVDSDTEVPLVDASMLIDKKVFSKISYDARYQRNAWREETDFQLAAYLNGFKTIYCPHVCSFHLYKKKNTGGNHSQNIIKYEFQILKNNWHMTRKYWINLQKSFGINYIHYFRFVIYRLLKYIR